MGFIVEGACEKIVLKSERFQNYLQLKDIQQVGDVIDMDGKGNLKASSQRMNTQVQLLRDQGAEWIVVLRDMDNASSFDEVKQEVHQADDVRICVAVQELEAWFLADSLTLSQIFNTKFHLEFPEKESKPFEALAAFQKQYNNRGISDKKICAKMMLSNGFTLENAARHPNCPSARYFLTKLQTLASAN